MNRPFAIHNLNLKTGRLRSRPKDENYCEEEDLHVEIVGRGGGSSQKKGQAEALFGIRLVGTP